MEMYQSPCHNFLEPITIIITIIIPEIVLVFMHQLAQLKQVIELSATEGYTFGITFHKTINANTSYPCFKKLVKIYIQNNNLDNLRLKIIEILFLLLELVHFLFLTLSYSLLTLCIMYILYYIVLYILA